MEGQPSGGWGAGADPSSMLRFLHYAVSNKRKTVVRRSYPLTMFLISSSSLGQVPRSDPTSRDGDTARSADKLTTRDFGMGTRGFAASEDAGVAVCVLPGTDPLLAKLRPR